MLFIKQYKISEQDKTMSQSQITDQPRHHEEETQNIDAHIMRGSRKISRGWGGGGPTMKTFFVFCLVDERREVPNSTISGPSSARQRNAI